MNRDFFKAIGDPTKRAILVLIASQAMTPAALATHFEANRQAIFKDIHVFTECKLLKHEKIGHEIHYKPNAVKMKEIDVWL